MANTQSTNGIERGFTLIELLVVLGIIVLVIAITLPAISGARQIARTTATQALMTELSTAIQQFRNDNNGTMPGAFTPAEMGNPQNATNGLTALQNVMLDIAGANAVLQQGDTNGTDINPTNDANKRITVNLSLIGTGSGVYFTPSATNFVVVEGQLGSSGMPDLIDAFGNPIMLWVEDPGATRTPTEINQFAQIDSGNNGSNRARFYWNSNAGNLASTQLGRSARNQSTLSLLGDSAPVTDRIEALAGVAGDPGSPTPVNYTANTVLPGSARGSYIIQSAGADGVFLARSDRGARALPDGLLRFRANFFSDTGGTRYTDPSNPSRSTSVDVLQEFDDVFVSGK